MLRAHAHLSSIISLQFEINEGESKSRHISLQFVSSVACLNNAPNCSITNDLYTEPTYRRFSLKTAKKYTHFTLTHRSIDNSRCPLRGNGYFLDFVFCSISFSGIDFFFLIISMTVRFTVVRITNYVFFSFFFQMSF